MVVLYEWLQFVVRVQFLIWKEKECNRRLSSKIKIMGQEDAATFHQLSNLNKKYSVGLRRIRTFGEEGAHANNIIWVDG